MYAHHNYNSPRTVPEKKTKIFFRVATHTLGKDGDLAFRGDGGILI